MQRQEHFLLSSQHQELNSILFQKLVFNFRFIWTPMVQLPWCLPAAANNKQGHQPSSVCTDLKAPAWLRQECPACGMNEGLWRISNWILYSTAREMWKTSLHHEIITVMSDSGTIRDRLPDLEIISTSTDTTLLCLLGFSFWKWKFLLFEIKSGTKQSRYQSYRVRQDPAQNNSTALHVYCYVSSRDI